MENKLNFTTNSYDSCYVLEKKENTTTQNIYETIVNLYKTYMLNLEKGRNYMESIKEFEYKNGSFILKNDLADDESTYYYQTYNNILAMEFGVDFFDDFRFHADWVDVCPKYNDYFNYFKEKDIEFPFEIINENKINIYTHDENIPDFIIRELINIYKPHIKHIR